MSVTETATSTPWAFRARNGPRNITLKRDHFEVGIDGGEGIALVFGDTDANARLIAAAPMMLTLLQSISADKSAYQWHTAIANVITLATR